MTGAALACSVVAGYAEDRAACAGNPDALGTARVLAVGAGEGLAVGLKSYPRTLALAPGEFVLTFDDGPLPATTARVLNALKHECVKATFFLIGRNAQANPGLVRRAIAEGHTIGHHSFSHPEVTLRGLTDVRARADIDRGFAADDTAAYGAADAAPRVPFFRFPGFADTVALRTWLAERHVTIFGADLWASDWNAMTPARELDLLMRRVRAAGSGIILLHDIKAQTAAVLPDFLAAMKAGGYRIVHLVPGPAQPPLAEAPAGWSSETERTLAMLQARRAAAPPRKTPVPPPAGEANVPGLDAPTP